MEVRGCCPFGLHHCHPALTPLSNDNDWMLAWQWQSPSERAGAKKREGTSLQRAARYMPLPTSAIFYLWQLLSVWLLFSLPLVLSESCFCFLSFFSFTIKGLSTIFVVLISSGYRISGHCLESNTEILIRRWYIELKISHCHYLKLSSKNNFLIKSTKVNQKHIFLVNAILHEILNIGNR